MSVAILIPARYASTRYPGKPLAPLRGADGSVKPLIRRTWEVAMAVTGVASVHVATDDARIREAAESFGAEVLMTSPDCENGTVRCAEAVEAAGIEAEIVVNLQGDAPLTPVRFLEALIAAMRTDPAAEVATPVLRCDRATLHNFVEDRRKGLVGGTTAVFDRTGNALYFSKEVIPYADGIEDLDPVPVFHHVGVYAYRRPALAAYRRWPKGPLESIEGLEQLRFLENGRTVRCVEVTAGKDVFWELNNPIDVGRIEAALSGELI